ncbi:2-keto-3-deoxy-phosphogalactonate aldolase [Tahibacter aquaticus]|uniref:2-keto-3-deoxy-phosphogalactonate aldolase n=1 Tax=Tahibacter aquaticus TaxID=520092 RepID=A0A4R6YUA8_9GAMM|nr:2-dehydro-3-deoxy-6-phosphogalactonate aldolase [Tahibacter aquaticus]TDR42043.1 2-keto-3-deoxy-phosphogalactonate aldolase [Tahibacter aquaticus]
MANAIERGVIAILRGVRPERVIQAAELCYRHGIRAIEVPLNSPQALTSIERLASHALPRCRIGAGTVLNVGEVTQVRAAGATFIVAPNVNSAVIRAALDQGLGAVPGFATASEAFAAIAAGATQLKLFPASSYGPAHLRALQAVLPAAVRVFPVGGIGAADCARWLDAGAAGLGFGSELFRPGDDDAQLEQRIGTLMQAYRTALGIPGDLPHPFAAE